MAFPLVLQLERLWPRASKSMFARMKHNKD